MLATNKFVFGHMPRSGGTFISEVIKKFFPSAHEIGHHLPRELLPREYLHLPILGAIRNPWEFYVSLYYYVWPKDAASVLASWMTENGRLGFIDSVRNLVNLGVNNERLDLLIEMLPGKVDYTKRNIPNVTKETMRKVRDTGISYYTFRFNHIFGNADDVFFCRVESLREDLVSFFEGVGVATDELRDYVLESEKKNISNHAHYSTYYTPELAKLIQIRDSQLIKRFGYVFEQDCSVEHTAPNLSTEHRITSL